MTLRSQIVDFVGADFLYQADQAGGIREIAIMKKEAAVLLMRILIKVLDAAGVEG